ncbi:hypothetical protein [Aestuariispira insulae]|uniref:Methyltransferase family protein n=1 Tax=Aestuariispira insulae TaxID=1461337 RepID=A0A3D9HE51_9PROT|nr:hypothetical protein [Aestuariispira insulae]RED47740.1 hypothetical protein DFP90_109104 [Aestuariispira insulae]
MGIEIQAARAMAHIFSQDIYDQARMLMLGRQFCRFGPDEVPSILEGSGYQVKDGISPEASVFHPSLIAAESYFRLLGCGDVKSMDVRPDEGAEIVFDLNNPVLPEGMKGGFDLIYDGGTTEHVINIVQAYAHIIDMLAVGGHVIHHLPCNGYVNEGFYQVNPTFLRGIYDANGMEVVAMAFFHWTNGVGDWSSVQVYNIQDKAHHQFYATDSFKNLSGGLDLVCLARKREQQSGFQLPIQDMYLK